MIPHNVLKLYLFHDSFRLRFGQLTIPWFSREEAIRVCQERGAPIVNYDYRFNEAPLSVLSEVYDYDAEDQS